LVARAAIAAALTLLRVYALVVVVGALVVFVIERRGWRAGHRRALVIAGVAVVAAALLYAPHVWLRDSAARVTQDVDFWRNLERDGVASYAPGGVSMFEWIFVEHSLVEVAGRCVKNLWLYLRDDLPFQLSGYGVAAWLVPPAAAVCVWRRRALLPAMIVLSLVPVLFILHLDQQPGRRGIDTRLLLQATPFALLTLGCAAGQGLFAIARRFGDAERLRSWLVGTASRPPQAAADSPSE
jgi:hypothetical protein